MKQLTKEQLQSMRKENIKNKILCSVCQKRTSFEITPDGQAICIKCWVEDKGEFTPEMEKNIATKAKGLPKLFVYKAFIRDHFKCTRCGIKLSQAMARPKRKENTINKLLKINHIDTMCPDCAAGNKIIRAEIRITDEIITYYRENITFKAKEKIKKTLRNVLDSAMLAGAKDNLRVYEQYPYTIIVDISKMEIVKISSSRPKKEAKKQQKKKKTKKENKPAAPKEKIKLVIKPDEFIKQAHKRFDGVCQQCGQRMDAKVAKFRRPDKTKKGTFENVELLCPYCKHGKRNLALKGYNVSDKALSLMKEKGYDEKTAQELLGGFAQKYVLVWISEDWKKKAYWTWDKTLPIRSVFVSGTWVVNVEFQNSNS